MFYKLKNIVIFSVGKLTMGKFCSFIVFVFFGVSLGRQDDAVDIVWESLATSGRLGVSTGFSHKAFTWSLRLLTSARSWV